MAPTTLYPAAIPHGRSALWTDQYNRDVAAMIMVLDHVAQQAHKVGMRKELLNELENSKFAHSVPFDSIRPCVN